MASRQITRLTRRSVRVRDTWSRLAACRQRRRSCRPQRIRTNRHQHSAMLRPPAPAGGWLPCARGAVADVARSWRSGGGGVAPVEYHVRLARRPTTTRPRCAPSAYPALVGEPRPGDRVLLNTTRWRWDWAPAGMHSSWPYRTASPTTGPDGAGACGEGPVHTAAGHGAGRRRGDAPHRTRLATADRSGRHAGGAGRSALRAAGDPAAGIPARAAGGLCDDRWWRAARLVLPQPDAAGRSTRRHGHCRSGVRRRSGGDQRAYWTVGRPARTRRRHRSGRAGPGQPRHRNPVGFLRRSRSARRSTPPRCSAAGRSARCASPMPTPRPRHRGMSHHCLTAYGRVALAPADLVVPAGLPRRSGRRGARRATPAAARHRIVEVRPMACDPRCASAGPAVHHGPDLDADPAYFLAAAAAGRHAATLASAASSRRTGSPGPTPTAPIELDGALDEREPAATRPTITSTQDQRPSTQVGTLYSPRRLRSISAHLRPPLLQPTDRVRRAALRAEPMMLAKLPG